MRRVMVALLFAVSAITTAIATAGCFGDYSVVRVHNGRPRAGRYIPSEAYAATLQASIAAEQGDWPTALSSLQVALDADPDAPDLYARIGTAQCHLGKRDLAMSSFERALKADPELERGYTERAACRLLQKPVDLGAVRADLNAALSSDPEAIDPALLMIALDVRTGNLRAARARSEEAVVLHPSSASAWRALAEVAARQSDASRTVAAAITAGALDEEQGKDARSWAQPVADVAGVAAYSLVMRGTHAPARASDPLLGDPLCALRLRALESIASHAENAATAVAAEAVRSACPRLDAEVTMIEVAAAWSPAKGEEVENRASTMPSAAARRWAARMRLRRMELAALLEVDRLPPAHDRETLALHVAVAAAKRAQASGSDPQATALAKAARDLAPAEPTVARLVATVAARAGKSASDAWRAAACALARTEVEKASCQAP